MSIRSINPATEEILAQYQTYDATQIEQILTQAQTTFTSWRETSFEERKKHMFRLAKLLRDDREHIGHIVTQEVGRPINASYSEVEKCAWVCEYYAEHAQHFLQDEHFNTEYQQSYVRFEPLGIILAVMPWNFPLWQVMRFAAPAAMAGNVGVLKHASNVPQCAVLLQEYFEKAGFPKGVFQTLLISSSEVEGIIKDDRVKALTLTGSEKAGGIVASQAAKEIKKTVLELGGSDPFIILEDADVAYACEVGVEARFRNNGQSCTSAKRFIVVEPRAEEFIERYTAITKAKIVGDPLDPQTEIGPLSSESALLTIQQQVDASVSMGANVLLGGRQMNRKGYFYEPTILVDIKKGMPVYDEETFGPVSAIIVAKDEIDAIRIANDTPYGLGASLWTADIERGQRLATQIQAGNVFINKMVRSDPRLPFGGIKKSGYGRELSKMGIREFVNVKTVVVE